jgi:hypothetical protein
MHPGTRTEESTPVIADRPRIRPRIARLLAAFAATGNGTPPAIARAAGIDTNSVRRAVHGAQVGEPFIAHTLATLGREEYRSQLEEVGIEPTFDSLFEVIDA